MHTLTATSARSSFFKLLKTTIKGHLQTRISSKEGNAILISEEDFESLLETAELLSVPGFKESIKKADREIQNKNTLAMKDVF